MGDGRGDGKRGGVDDKRVIMYPGHISVGEGGVEVSGGGKWR